MCARTGKGLQILLAHRGEVAEPKGTSQVPVEASNCIVHAPCLPGSPYYALPRVSPRPCPDSCHVSHVLAAPQSQQTFNKVDVSRHQFALDWMNDFETFAQGECCCCLLFVVYWRRGVKLSGGRQLLVVATGYCLSRVLPLFHPPCHSAVSHLCPCASHSLPVCRCRLYTPNPQPTNNQQQLWRQTQATPPH